MSISIGTCVECGTENTQLNQEHIIPMWLINRIYLFGFSHGDVVKAAGIDPKDLIMKMCIRCNVSKGGIIIFQNRLVERYMREFTLMLGNRLMYLYKKRRLIVICQCKECKPEPTTFNKVVSKANAISSVEAHKIALATHNQKPLPVGLSIPKEPYEIKV